MDYDREHWAKLRDVFERKAVLRLDDKLIAGLANLKPGRIKSPPEEKRKKDAYL